MFPVRCVLFPPIENAILHRGINSWVLNTRSIESDPARSAIRPARLSLQNGMDRLSGSCPKPTCVEVRPPSRLPAQVLRYIEFGE